jgi:GABA permease
MGIPFATEIRNAMVLTAVLSRLNSGPYTASRTLFVLAGRHEPLRRLEVNGRGGPVAAILHVEVRAALPRPTTGCA